MKGKKKTTRSECSTYLAKAMAYMEVGKLEDARTWATILQQKLIDLTLLVDNRQTNRHNGSQSENKTTPTTKGTSHA